MTTTTSVSTAIAVTASHRHLRLFQIRRAGIGCFARDREARGWNHHRWRPVVVRRRL